MTTAIIQTKRAEASRLLSHYGPWAVVTGASDGIGRELARQLAVAGLNLLLVARGTLDALGQRGTVRPGWLSKLLEWALAPLPRWGRVRMMGLVMGGMTSHQVGGRPATGAAATGAPPPRPAE